MAGRGLPRCPKEDLGHGDDTLALASRAFTTAAVARANGDTPAVSDSVTSFETTVGLCLRVRIDAEGQGSRRRPRFRSRRGWAA